MRSLIAVFLISLITISNAEVPLLKSQQTMSKTGIFACQSTLGTTRLTDEGAKTLLDVRLKANKHCLSCTKKNCELRSWLDNEPEAKALCSSLYCVPMSSPSLLTTKNASWAPHAAEVFFEITENGRGELTSMEFLGNPQSLLADQSDIERTVAKQLSDSKFVPLLVDGQPRRITKLSFTYRKTHADNAVTDMLDFWGREADQGIKMSKKY